MSARIAADSSTLLKFHCQALLLQILLCVSSEAAFVMRAGLSVGGVSNLHHQTGCMLRCSKGQGRERCNR